MKKWNALILLKNVFLKKKPLSFHSFKVLSKLFKQNDAFFKQAKKMPSFLVDWESAEQKVYEKQ